MNGLAYSSKQLDVLLTVVTLLLPLSTGFVVVVGATLPKLAATGVLKNQLRHRLLTGSFVLIVCSIGLWSGCLAFVVDSARPFEIPAGAVPPLNLRFLNAEWAAAIACAQLGLLSFFLAVLCYSAAAYRALEIVVSETTK